MLKTKMLEINQIKPHRKMSLLVSLDLSMSRDLVTLRVFQNGARPLGDGRGLNDHI